MANSYKISDIAEITGTAPSTLRQWEQHGLLTPGRTLGGQRLYSEDDLETVRHIKRMREVQGLNLPAIRSVLRPSVAASAETENAVNNAGADNNAVDKAAALSGSIGDRLRVLRRDAGLSVRTAAERTGLPASFISTVERTSRGASVASLQKLANCYGLSVLELMRAPEASATADDGVVRAADARVMPMFGQGVTLHQLTENATLLSGQKWIFEPGSASGGSYRHEGEEFLYVLEGQIQILLDANSEFTLGPGDSITFDSRRPHGWRAPGPSRAVVLWINTPPTF
jgi:DNA-binding transcriptional MerR regulator/quercetin dioxygenase-like cupin family protein